MEYGRLIYKQRKDATPQSYTLQLGSTTIGLDESNDLVLNAEGISRFHARIICTSTNCTITDLESTNGTWLNQVRLPANSPQQLRHGDTLRIGNYAIRYQRTPATAPTTEVRAAPQPIETQGVPDPKPVPTPTILPPEIAAKQPQRYETRASGVRRLPGNSGPPRFPPIGPRKLDESGYMQYLPPIYHDQDFMRRFLLIFESILDPLDRMIDQISYYFDPRITPELFLPWLASWVDLLLNEKWPVDRRRALIHAASELYHWRGTKRGLEEFIRIYTGIKPIIIEPAQARQASEQQLLPAHTFIVRLELADPESIDRTLLEAIIDAEKPAHTSYLLEIRRSEGVSTT